MKSLRKNNLTIESIRLEIFEKSSWITKRTNIEDQDRERIFLPSKRYLQAKQIRAEGKMQRQRIMSEEIEKVIYRSVFMKQASDREKRKRSNIGKDQTQLPCCMRKSKTTLKIEKLDLMCKHLSGRSSVFIKNDGENEVKIEDRRYQLKMQRPPSIVDRRHATQGNEETVKQKKSLLLTPIVDADAADIVGEDRSIKKKAVKIPDLLSRRMNKYHKFSLKSKETQISPWRSDSLAQTLNHFVK